MLSANIKNQMELGFDRQGTTVAEAQHQRAAGRAQWWFKRMRQVVDLAMEWQPAPAPRPEQGYLELSLKRCN